jgi:hypothetical protein
VGIRKMEAPPRLDPSLVFFGYLFLCHGSIIH